MKKCFKCGTVKPLEQFYKHPQMGDGRLNKCIDCTKKDVSHRYSALAADPVFVEKERKRGRVKHHRLYKGKKSNASKFVKRYMELHPEQLRAKHAAQYLSKPFPEAQKHHWSYNEEHYKDVIWMTRKAHEKAHRFLTYDGTAKKFRRSDNNQLLESKEQHEEWINYCLKNFED